MEDREGGRDTMSLYFMYFCVMASFPARLLQDDVIINTKLYDQREVGISRRRRDAHVGTVCQGCSWEGSWVVFQAVTLDLTGGTVSSTGHPRRMIPSREGQAQCPQHHR